MSSVRTLRRYVLDHGDIEMELTNHPDSEPVVEETEDKILVGYLVQDEDCQNPCEDQDGMGHIRSFSNRHINNIDPQEAEILLESDPDIVPLSYFEHGQCLWDVCGGERIGGCPDMRWDGVRFAGIWIPDDCCREEIKLAGRSKAKKRARAVELAEQCCREYTSWANGDCWGICVDVFDKTGQKIAEDACWGHIGSDWAEQALADMMKGQK